MRNENNELYTVSYVKRWKYKPYSYTYRGTRGKFGQFLYTNLKYFIFIR